MPKKHEIMRHKTTLTFWILITIFCFSCNHKFQNNSTNESSDNFIKFLNHYQKDSLQDILAKNFQLTRTYTNYKNDLNSFLGEYLEYSKAFNGKYRILETISFTEPKIYLVEDESAYLEYLRVALPKWKITIKRNVQNKVEQVIIDTTSSFERYKTEISSKEEYFKNWLKINHPTENLEELQKNKGLLFERLKLYYNQN